MMTIISTVTGRAADPSSTTAASAGFSAGLLAAAGLLLAGALFCLVIPKQRPAVDPAHS